MIKEEKTVKLKKQLQLLTQQHQTLQIKSEEFEDSVISLKDVIDEKD
jgi:hypothetical protein